MTLETEEKFKRKKKLLVLVTRFFFFLDRINTLTHTHTDHSVEVTRVSQSTALQTVFNTFHILIEFADISVQCKDCLAFVILGLVNNPSCRVKTVSSDTCKPTSHTTVNTYEEQRYTKPSFYCWYTLLHSLAPTALWRRSVVSLGGR